MPKTSFVRLTKRAIFPNAWSHQNNVACISKIWRSPSTFVLQNLLIAFHLSNNLPNFLLLNAKNNLVQKRFKRSKKMTIFGTILLSMSLSKFGGAGAFLQRCSTITRVRALLSMWIFKMVNSLFTTKEWKSSFLRWWPWIRTWISVLTATNRNNLK